MTGSSAHILDRVGDDVIRTVLLTWPSAAVDPDRAWACGMPARPVGR